MGCTPEPADCVKTSEVQKLNTSGVWKDRVLYLTEDEISIALPGASNLKDKVPLEAIRLVSCRQSEEELETPGSTDMLKAKSIRAWEQIEAAAGGSQDFDHDAVFIVHVVGEESSSDRAYSFRTRSQAEKEEWIREIKQTARRAKQRRLAAGSPLLRLQQTARRVYVSSPFQSLVALLIVANFIANAAQSELQPASGSTEDVIFSHIDMIFTIVFATELVVNMTAHWFYAFWSDGWSVFDFIIVVISLVSLAFEAVPGPSPSPPFSFSSSLLHSCYTTGPVA
jgi:hypothetical protein